MNPHSGRTNFFYLLVALLIMLFVIPLADDFDLVSARLVRGLVFSCLLIIGVWSLEGGGRYFSVGMAFVISGVALNALAFYKEASVLQHTSMLLLIGFMLVAIAYTLRQVWIGTDINANRLVGTNRLAGAICVYLLLGVIWAMAYTLLHAVSPGSFAGFSPMHGRGWDSEWLYFSFVTMTTLGYGDILPVSATARGLAYMQAVVGQFYLAILVAGLVSAYITGRRDRNNDPR